MVKSQLAKDECIQLINKTEDYIETHLSEKITLDDLANHVLLSKYYFHRLFSQFNDESIYQFIIRIKMERAGIFLVVREDIRMIDIAFQYGYDNVSSFNKAFKKQFNLSPSAYRKARKDKKV